MALRLRLQGTVAVDVPEVLEGIRSIHGTVATGAFVTLGGAE